MLKDPTESLSTNQLLSKAELPTPSDAVQSTSASTKITQSLDTEAPKSHKNRESTEKSSRPPKPRYVPLLPKPVKRYVSSQPLYPTKKEISTQTDVLGTAVRSSDILLEDQCTNTTNYIQMDQQTLQQQTHPMFHRCVRAAPFETHLYSQHGMSSQHWSDPSCPPNVTGPSIQSSAMNIRRPEPSDFGTQTSFAENVRSRTVPISNLGTQTALSALLEEVSASSSSIELQCELGNASLQLLSSDEAMPAMDDAMSFGTQTNLTFEPQSIDHDTSLESRHVDIATNIEPEEISDSNSVQCQPIAGTTSGHSQPINESDSINPELINSSARISSQQINISTNVQNVSSFGTQTTSRCDGDLEPLKIPESFPLQNSTSDFSMQFPYELMDFGTQTSLLDTEGDLSRAFMFDDELLDEHSSGSAALLSQSSTQTDLDFLFNHIETQTDWQM